MAGSERTDGPNGARGSAVLGAGEATAVCVPCGDPDWPALRERLAGSPFGVELNPTPDPGWRVDPGRYELYVGRSSADIAHVAEVSAG